MLTRLKKIFFRQTAHPVETYGKLPCYKDYISIVMTAGAAQWRTWLLESFQGKIMPPPGIWHFIYQHQKNADPVVGVITASSDGIRQFPFTLFTVCGRGTGQDGLCSRATAILIWQELEGLYRQLVGAADINDFYAQLQGKKISPAGELDPQTAGDREFSGIHGGEWPRMLVAGARDTGILHLIQDGKTSNEEFAHNWYQVSAAMRSCL